MPKDKSKQSKDNGQGAGSKSGANRTNSNSGHIQAQNVCTNGPSVPLSGGIINGQVGCYVQGQQNQQTHYNGQNTVQGVQQGVQQIQGKSMEYSAGNYHLDQSFDKNPSYNYISDVQHIGDQNSNMQNWTNSMNLTGAQAQTFNTHFMPNLSPGVLIPTSTQVNSGVPNFIQKSNGFVSSQNNDSSNNSQVLNSLAQSIQQMNAEFLHRLDHIAGKVSKLETIEKDVSHTRVDVTRLKEENIELRQKMVEMEKSCATISDMFDTFKVKTSESESNIKALQIENAQLRSEITNISSKQTKVFEDLLEVKTRSMQENLLFFGIAEPPPGINDNVEMKLRDFLVTELNQPEETIQNITFDRVHRIGRPKFDPVDGRSRSRPIVAKFQTYTDRELIRKEGIQLNMRRNGFSIREQYPPEIEARRKLLYPVMRNYARDDKNRVALVRDKLYVNGELYTVQQDQSNTENKIVVKQSAEPSSVSESRPERRFARPNVSRGRSQRQAQVTDKNARSLFETSNQFSVFNSPASSSDIKSGTKQKARSPLENTEVKRYCEKSTSQHDLLNDSVSLAQPENETEGNRDVEMISSTHLETDPNDRSSTLGDDISIPSVLPLNLDEPNSQAPEPVPANTPSSTD